MAPRTAGSATIVGLACLLAAEVGLAADITWTNQGPGGGGYIQSIAWDLREPDTIHLGCDVGGYYVSHDAGCSWTIHNQGLRDYFVQCIAQHPTDPNVILLGLEGGVYKSTDRGATWPSPPDSAISDSGTMIYREVRTMTRREIQPDTVPRPVAEYAQGVEVTGGRTLYIAGQVSLDASGQFVGPGDIRAQTRQVLGNIRAIIEEAGGQISDIVKMTTFLTDMADYAGFVEVRKEFLQAPFPAATLVEVSALVRPEWLVEVEAIAVLD